MPFHFLTFKCKIKGWNFPNINYSLSSIINTYHCSLKHPSKTGIHAHWFPTSQSSGEMGYKWNTIMNSETNLIGMQCECKVYSWHHSRIIRYIFIALIGMLWTEQVYFCIMYFKGFYNLFFPCMAQILQMNGKTMHYIFPHARVKIARDSKDHTVSGKANWALWSFLTLMSYWHMYLFFGLNDSLHFRKQPFISVIAHFQK